MLNIFKYFVGIIAVLILAYVLIAVIRTVIFTGFTTTAEIASSTALEQGTASGTQQIAQALQGITFASLSEWLLKNNSLKFSPIYVGYDQQNANYSFFGDNEGKGMKTQEQLYWQNLNDAPDDHPTDWVPVGKSYAQTLIDSQNGAESINYDENGNEIVSEENAKPNASLIKPNLSTGSDLSDNEVITGKAYFKVFTQRVFPIFVLDRDGNTVGGFKAFANSDIGPDGMASFRAVLDLNGPRIPYGYLMFKNDNFEMSQIKAVTVIPVLFNY